jgi:hypothetical protein
MNPRTAEYRSLMLQNKLPKLPGRILRKLRERDKGRIARSWHDDSTKIIRIRASARPIEISIR